MEIDRNLIKPGQRWLVERVERIDKFIYEKYVVEILSLDDDFVYGKKLKGISNYKSKWSFDSYNYSYILLRNQKAPDEI